jgi:hypothetical protein
LIILGKYRKVTGNVKMLLGLKCVKVKKYKKDPEIIK